MSGCGVRRSACSGKDGSCSSLTVFFMQRGVFLVLLLSVLFFCFCDSLSGVFFFAVGSCFLQFAAAAAVFLSSLLWQFFGL